ncbi:MAG: FAD-linked oxidase C-terminal domain-containing protein [Beijerinckiaceae bacterium]|nr:FAD-linked oxidase C-terminal domain-containing protein [Beijerinckiaceae bacterium]
MATPSDPLPGLGAWADETETPPPPPAPRSRDLAAALAEIAEHFGDRYTQNESTRQQHAHTLTWTQNEPPDAVVYPQTTEEVAQIVKTCAAYGVPVIAFGTGTSLEGHVNAPMGGVCVDTSLMKRIVAIHTEDLDCVVEAGVTRKELNDALRHTGLFFPIDPGADASLGGMASTRASGTNAVRYGTMKDNVLALTVVTASGEIMQTGSRARKSSAGYDLTRLFVGAEGTLGIITEITLRLQGLPESIVGGVCPFPSVKAACDATILTIQSGLPVARIELLDALAVRAVNLHSKLDLPETPMLLVEFHGTPASAREQAERFGEIAAELGGGPFTHASKPEERTKLWQARHDAYWAGFTLRPGAKGLATDICVPISRLAECVTQTQADMAESNLIGPIIGHVGDGNFHVNLLFDVDDDEEISRVEDFLERLVERGLSMDGTCTGEHGVGQAKLKYMALEHDAPALAIMRALKSALDPQGIMNPGKLVG